MKKPTVIFMGSKPGSVAALSVLLRLGWEIKYVVVPKNISYGWIKGPALSTYALENNLIVLNQSEIPKSEKVDFVISYMYRYMVKPEVINMAECAALNFHAGPLPEFGGWAFYNVAILENVSEYGCACHYMTEKFDDGPILKVRKFVINPTQETAASLEKKSQEEMVHLFIDFCKMVENHEKLPKTDQDIQKKRYLTKQEFEKLKEIPMDSNSEYIDRCARAFWYPPFECAYFNIGESRVEIVPKIVKEQLATFIHSNDFESLQNIVENYFLETNYDSN